MGARTIETRLSGGGSNANSNLSLGGVMSSVELAGNVNSFAGAGVGGVTLLDSKSGTGTIGTLYFTLTGSTLGYQKTGGNLPSIANEIDVSSGGEYSLLTQEGTDILNVLVVPASLPASDDSDAIVAVKINPNLFDNVTESESTEGSVKFRHMYIYNPTALGITIVCYFSNNYSGLNTLSLGFENITSGAVDELLVDEFTPPVGINFNSPTQTADAIVLTIAPLQQVGMFMKREVSPLSDSVTEIDTATLIFESI